MRISVQRRVSNEAVAVGWIARHDALLEAVNVEHQGYNHTHGALLVMLTR